MIKKWIIPAMFIATSSCITLNAEDAAPSFSEKKCIPCSEKVPPLKGEDLIAYKQQLRSEWNIVDEHHLERKYLFDDFLSALAFTNRLGELAEETGHHPDIVLSYGKVVVMIWTHKSRGLTESDFILASLIDAMDE